MGDFFCGARGFFKLALPEPTPTAAPFPLWPIPGTPLTLTESVDGCGLLDGSAAVFRKVMRLVVIVDVIVAVLVDCVD